MVKWERIFFPNNGVGAHIILCEHIAEGVTSTCRLAQQVRLSKDTAYLWEHGLCFPSTAEDHKAS